MTCCGLGRIQRIHSNKSDRGTSTRTFLVGGFNPSEKYWSNWIISPNRDENKKCLKPPPSFLMDSGSNETPLFLLKTCEIGLQNLGLFWGLSCKILDFGRLGYQNPVRQHNTTCETIHVCRVFDGFLVSGMGKSNKYPQKDERIFKTTR